MAFTSKALRFQAPVIIITAIAPTVCLVDDMATKHVFATLYYVACGFVMGSIGVVNVIAFGMVIRETEQIMNKSEGTLKSLANMKRLKREATSQSTQNAILCFLFAAWPFLQVRASWNISIAFPLVVHVLIAPIATKLFWPKDTRRSRKVNPEFNPCNFNPDLSVNSTVGQTTVENDDGTRGDGCNDDGDEARPATRVPI